MRYSGESKMVKCESCGKENGVQNVLGYIVCKKCSDFMEKGKELNKWIKTK